MHRYRRLEPHVTGTGTINTGLNPGSLSTSAAVSDLIGIGAYGRVYRGYDNVTNTFVALKTLKSGDPGEGFYPSTLREITLLRRLNHENIVRLLDVIQSGSSSGSASASSIPSTSSQQGGRPEENNNGSNSNSNGNSNDNGNDNDNDTSNRQFYDNNIILVLELVDVDLKLFMDRNPTALDLNLVKSFTKQILCGISHCHSVGVMHRDLKPQNILVRTNQNTGTDNRVGDINPFNYTIKIADFGLSRTYGFTPRPLTTEVVTLWYRAPELLLGCEFYDKSVDIWSVACVMLEMSSEQKDHKAAFLGINQLDQLFKIFHALGTPQTAVSSTPPYSASFNELLWPEVAEFPYWSNTFPQWLPKSWEILAPRLDNIAHMLLESMLTYSPRRRITAYAALQHPYFRDEEYDEQQQHYPDAAVYAQEEQEGTNNSGEYSVDPHMEAGTPMNIMSRGVTDATPDTVVSRVGMTPIGIDNRNIFHGYNNSYTTNTTNNNNHHHSHPTTIMMSTISRPIPIPAPVPVGRDYNINISASHGHGRGRGQSIHVFQHPQLMIPIHDPPDKDTISADLSGANHFDQNQDDALPRKDMSEGSLVSLTSTSHESDHSYTNAYNNNNNSNSGSSSSSMNMNSNINSHSNRMLIRHHKYDIERIDTGSSDTSFQSSFDLVLPMTTGRDTLGSGTDTNEKESTSISFEEENTNIDNNLINYPTTSRSTSSTMLIGSFSNSNSNSNTSSVSDSFSTNKSTFNMKRKRVGTPTPTNTHQSIHRSSSLSSSNKNITTNNTTMTNMHSSNQSSGKIGKK